MAIIDIIILAAFGLGAIIGFMKGFLKQLASQRLSGGTDSVAQAQQEIRDMMNRLKLVEDDVKGATVNQSI